MNLPDGCRVMEVISLVLQCITIFLIAICAYCLCVALTRNSTLDDHQTRYLRFIAVVLKHFIRLGGITFVLMLVFFANA